MTDDHDADGPPFGIDLIADLHAGVLSEERAAALWPRVRADPEARRVLEALDATRDDLAAAPVPDESPPEAVTAAIQTTLRAIRADQARASEDRARVESLEDARDRRRDATRRRGLLVALAVAGVIAVVTLVVAVSTATLSSQGTVQNADDPTTPTTTSAAATGATGDTPPAALLSVLGRTDAAFDGTSSASGPSAVSARLRRCLGANGVAPSTPVVGSGPLTVGGATRTVVLLSTGVAGRFEALVVGAGCDTGSPALISRTTIGAAPPTR